MPLTTKNTQERLNDICDKILVLIEEAVSTAHRDPLKAARTTERWSKALSNIIVIRRRDEADQTEGSG
jgi:hypothetical protein